MLLTLTQKLYIEFWMKNNASSLVISNLHHATGARSDFCSFLLSQVQSLKIQQEKFTDMFESYQGLASKYLDQSSQMEKLQQSFTDFKKKNDELKLINNYMDLSKKCDLLQQDKNKLIQKVEA